MNWSFLSVFSLLFWWPIYMIMNSSSFINTNPIYSWGNILPAVEPDSFRRTLSSSVLRLYFVYMFYLFNTLVSLIFSSSMSSFWPLTGHKIYKGGLKSTYLQLMTSLTNEIQALQSMFDMPIFDYTSAVMSVFNCIPIVMTVFNYTSVVITVFDYVSVVMPVFNCIPLAVVCDTF